MFSCVVCTIPFSSRWTIHILKRQVAYKPSTYNWQQAHPSTRIQCKLYVPEQETGTIPACSTRHSAHNVCASLQKLDVLYHSAIHFVTNVPFRIHHSTSYSSMFWWNSLVHVNLQNTPLSLSPAYLWNRLQVISATYNTRSAHLLI